MGPAMPSADMLAAAARLTEAESLLRFRISSCVVSVSSMSLVNNFLLIVATDMGSFLLFSRFEYAFRIVLCIVARSWNLPQRQRFCKVPIVRSYGQPHFNPDCTILEVHFGCTSLIINLLKTFWKLLSVGGQTLLICSEP